MKRLLLVLVVLVVSPLVAMDDPNREEPPGTHQEINDVKKAQRFAELRELIQTTLESGRVQQEIVLKMKVEALAKYWDWFEGVWRHGNPPGELFESMAQEARRVQIESFDTTVRDSLRGIEMPSGVIKEIPIEFYVTLCAIKADLEGYAVLLSNAHQKHFEQTTRAVFADRAYGRTTGMPAESDAMDCWAEAYAKNGPEFLDALECYCDSPEGRYDGLLGKMACEVVGVGPGGENDHPRFSDVRKVLEGDLSLLSRARKKHLEG